MSKDKELDDLRQQNQTLREAAQTLRQGLREAIQAIETHQCFSPLEVQKMQTKHALECSSLVWRSWQDSLRSRFTS